MILFISVVLIGILANVVLVGLIIWLLNKIKIPERELIDRQYHKETGND